MVFLQRSNHCITPAFNPIHVAKALGAPDCALLRCASHESTAVFVGIVARVITVGDAIVALAPMLRVAVVARVVTVGDAICFHVTNVAPMRSPVRVAHIIIIQA